MKEGIKLAKNKEQKSGKHVPYVTKKQRGGSPAILIMGIILAIIFGASTAYSGMKAGLTVAAGIPGLINWSGFGWIFFRKKRIFGKNIM